MQYEIAESRLLQLQKQHARKLKDAYDGIHPTRVAFDYELGKLYSESVNTAEYALYLVELREEQERLEKWWEIRALAFKEAFALLSKEDKKGYFSGFHKRKIVREKIKEILARIIEDRKELKRVFVLLNDLEDLEEVDRQIDNMGDEELFKEYWDKEAIR